MDQLETLKYGQGNSGLNVYIEGEVAFVGNPFTLEGPDGSHLIDWGTSDLNARMEQYIQDRPGGTALHTFFWHSRTGKWFYIGAHIWTPVGLTWEVWRTLSERSQEFVANRLRMRGGEVETEAQIIAQLDSNRLEQIVIELSSVGQRETSEAFLREYGLSPRRRHPRLS
ncbi:hypothetical protein CONPUDRAFT_81851 [Coniophora puteana RWD-64-598 SS2]|uniref:Uncharacterized protein n=1 Tax=Coniophora puteana (strain RWD-64-598) TaxID=741705 RepID=A0A5M3MTE8_CONPW|nr:uncharacterized protein CONPUDRAFT_81851 [Coniophora puteana RWD-64-598 SS2]EIW82360.1 hypothetical protein CONPUDRAFT_81851 [Coniophora puteana RWD-64-598 SS2]